MAARILIFLTFGQRENRPSTIEALGLESPANKGALAKNAETKDADIWCQDDRMWAFRMMGEND